MIISVNTSPPLVEFENLMKKTDLLLNDDAKKRPDYYKTRGGSLLEKDVKSALEECSKGTSFQGTIELISGQRFPDIVASKCYGIEVKSTKDNHWTSTGSSILESTRVEGIERIFMTFGKLGGNPIEFLSKPYEQCLSGIAVTHMPRYLIDMCLRKGQTIFDKLGIPYDSLRKMDNPIAPVAKYYRNQLKTGERLWWTGDDVDESVSATIRLWKNLSLEEKTYCKINALVLFPEIFQGNYDEYSLWLTSKGIVDSHLRDQFSAGGQEEYCLATKEIVRVPAIYRRVHTNIDGIIEFFSSENNGNLVGAFEKIYDWCVSVSNLSPISYNLSMNVLLDMFKKKNIDLYPFHQRGFRYPEPDPNFGVMYVTEKK